jgi:hypothetical protein
MIRHSFILAVLCGTFAIFSAPSVCKAKCPSVQWDNSSKGE